MAECDICRGRQTVRLPVYQPLKFSAEAVPDVPMESSREFPCPQCREVVTVGKVGAIREETYAALQYANEPGFIQHVREGLAHMLAGQLLKSGYIQFRRGPDDEREMRFQMVATVGVVHPSKLDTLEQRIAERQHVVASEVADEAARQIDNFGSYYGAPGVSKQTARQLIGEALRNVLKRRAPPWGGERRVG